jgi:hypothetical protein
MSEMGEIYGALREERRRLRAAFGVSCPHCRDNQPRRDPSILLPGQKCKVDGYVDPRPPLTKEQRESIWK